MPVYYKHVRTVVLVIAIVGMVVAAYFAGVQLSSDDDTSRAAMKAAFIIDGGPAIILMVFVLLLLQNLAWRVRMDGTRIAGIGVMGPVSVDLASLTAVKETSSRQGDYLSLRDDRTSIMVNYKYLTENQYMDRIAEAVRSRGAAGALTISRRAATTFGVSGRDFAGTRTAPATTLMIVGVVVLFLAGIIVGLTVA